MNEKSNAQSLFDEIEPLSKLINEKAKELYDKYLSQLSDKDRIKIHKEFKKIKEGSKHKYDEATYLILIDTELSVFCYERNQSKE